ncbi:septation protein SepH [Sporichthya polymorpha]|uniref:septation protein SepH n=1 Tax=Sporichthya polymorpha TaxID=35751 RepID=UPI00035EFEB9|nr:septation protein SepH [Sporichthya polymorpha]
MQDLRLVAANERGTHLVLRSPDGEKFVVPIDERLRAAIRGDKTLLSQLDAGVGQLRPREIQARIRAGESAEQVAAAAGVHVDRVRRFEGPVLAEREHMAQMSQRASVRRPGQAELRPNTLAESVPAQLQHISLAPTDLSWDSWRRDDGRWLVQVSYEHDALTQRATFLFDPRARTVVAENDQARFLTGELEQHPAREPFRPRIAAPVPLRAAEPVTAVEDDEDVEIEAEEQAAPPSLRRPDPTLNRRPPDVIARRPEPAPAPAPAPRPATVVTPPPPAPSVVPPLPAAAPAPAPMAPAAKAAPAPAPMEERAPAPPAPAVEAPPRRSVIDTPTLPMDPPPTPAEAMPARRTGTHDASADDAPAPTPTRSGGRRRARVPSWDDILIGTRPKE